jgi:hypothetical protein
MAIMYSRGYKNRAIAKICLEISPIFNTGTEWQILNLMTFLTPGRTLFTS